MADFYSILKKFFTQQYRLFKKFKFKFKKNIYFIVSRREKNFFEQTQVKSRANQKKSTVAGSESYFF
jgi:hypothetical protein